MNSDNNITNVEPVEDVEFCENRENIEDVKKNEKKRGGTPPNKQRNFSCYRYEIIYVNKEKKIIHEKFSSSTQIISNTDIPIQTKQQFYYYLTAKEKMNLKNIWNKHTMTVKKINEKIIK